MRRLLRGIGDGLMLLLLAVLGSLTLLFMWPAKAVQKWWRGRQLRRHRARQPQP